MLKIIPPGAWGDLLPPPEPVKAASAGISGYDFSVLLKRASHPLALWVKDHPPRPGEVYVHSVAMGSTEKFGANRNSDGFPNDMLLRDHLTFEKYARWYRDHINTDPAKSYGVVRRAIYDADLGRVETLVALNGTKAAAERNGGLVADKELDLLEADRDLPVSMSVKIPYDECLIAGTRIVTSAGERAVEDVREGDEVLTHTGRYRPVTGTMRRDFTGELVTLSVAGLYGPLTMTDNHPVYVVKDKDLNACPGRKGVRRNRHRTDRTTGVCSDCRQAVRPNFQWVPADAVETDDYVAFPRIKPGTRSVGVEQAYLLGVYGGNGSVATGVRGGKENPHREVIGVTITQGTAHPGVIAKIGHAATAIHGRVQPFATTSSSDNAVVTTICDREFAAKCQNWVGCGAKNKFVGPEVFELTEPERIAFLAGLIDTDGSVDPGKGNGQFVSSSLELAAAAQRLFFGLGHAPTLHGYVVKHGLGKGAMTYILSFARPAVRMLAAYSDKAARVAMPPKTKREQPGHAVVTADHVCFPIRDVTRTAATCEVFNFSVADDESYVANGVTVHNCSVCGHKAKHRGEYCLSKSAGGTCDYLGCRHGLGRVYEDGTHQFVQNPIGQFFDLSNVSRTRGADRTAFVTGKVAGHYAPGGAELAEMMGLVPPEHLLTPEKLAQLRTLRKIAALTPKAQAGLPWAETLAVREKLAAHTPRYAVPGDDAGRWRLLGDLAAAGVVLPPAEWLRVVTGAPADKCAAALAGGVDVEKDLLQRPDLHDLLDGPFDIRLSAKAAYAWMAPTPASRGREAALAVVKAASQGEKAARESPLPPAQRAEVAARYCAYLGAATAPHENSQNFPLLLAAAASHTRPHA